MCRRYEDAALRATETNAGHGFSDVIVYLSGGQEHAETGSRTQGNRLARR